MVPFPTRPPWTTHVADAGLASCNVICTCMSREDRGRIEVRPGRQGDGCRSVTCRQARLAYRPSWPPHLAPKDLLTLSDPHHTHNHTHSRSHSRSRSRSHSQSQSQSQSHSLTQSHSRTYDLLPTAVNTPTVADSEWPAQECLPDRPTKAGAQAELLGPHLLTLHALQLLFPTHLVMLHPPRAETSGRSTTVGITWTRRRSLSTSSRRVSGRSLFKPSSIPSSTTSRPTSRSRLLLRHSRGETMWSPWQLRCRGILW